MQRTWRICGFVAVALMLGQVGCGKDDKAPPAKVTKAAWVYIGETGDGGWTYAHNQGRLQVESDLQNVATSYVENILDTDAAAAEAAIRAVAQQGPDIIFTTSFGYMEPTRTVAAEFPDIKFEHCSGYEDGPNFVNYFGRIEQAVYLTGIVAGRKTTNHKVGYVAPFAIPECFRGVNAFTLGVRSVDPSATVYVYWTNTWYGPADEQAGAVSLITNQGVDIIAHGQDSTAAVLAARDAGIYAIGYDTDMLSADPATVLTSAIWHWGPYYVSRVKAVQDGTWTATDYWGGVGDGIVGIGQYGAMVDSGIQAEVATAKASIANGTLDIFAGPILKADGTTWVAAGAALSDADQLAMADIVQGVVETNAR